MSPNNFLKFLLICCALLFAFASRAQEVEWDRTIGGTDDDALTSLQQTADGGYILSGYSNSDISGDKSEASRGGYDFWVIKLDASGKKQWDKTYGGSSSEVEPSLIKTRDGGYMMGGGSFSGISGDKSEPSRGSEDYWIIKIDVNGNKEWDRTFGGEGQDRLTSLQQTSDGGYILGGFSDSGISGDKSQERKGPGGELVYDYWVIKIDADGNKDWDKTIGGDDTDILTSLQQTTDGGYIVGGYSDSGISGDKSEPSRGGYDFWIVKLSATGDKEWDKRFGGDNNEGLGALQLTSLEQTVDGGYILGGGSASGISGDKTEANRGNSDDPFSYDFWVIKIDASGAKEWDKTFGGDSDDYIVSLQQTSDHGYLLGGTSSSGVSGEKSEPSGAWNDDYWVVKLNASGDLEWEETIGGNGIDLFKSLQQTMDGGYLLGGSSSSGIGRDKTEPNYSIEDFESTDYWIVKLSPEAPCSAPAPSIAVVPTSEVYTGGEASTIYLGYGPQSVQLVASGGEQYAWSPADGLSEPSIADPVFTPTAAGSYTFTVTAYNDSCPATASVTITVVDARCGNGKVLLSHHGKQLCLSPSAVAAHLRHHPQDRLGSCGADTGRKQAVALRVFPNPLSDLATVEFTLPKDMPYRLELYNSGGKRLGVIAEGKGPSSEQVHQELRAEKLHKGLYYLRLITSEEVQTLRLLISK